MQRASAFLLLLLAAACAPDGAMPDGAGPTPGPVATGPDGTIVTDYGGGTAPVAQYVRRPDGTAVPVGTDPGTQPAMPGKPASDGAVAEAPSPADRRGGRPVGTGSAFAVTANGMAVTNAHVVRGCRSVTDDQGRPVRIIASDRGRDLALISVGHGFPSVVRFRDRATVDLGETVLVFGFPYGQALGTGINVTNGIVTGLAGPGGDASRFQMNAAVQPGNSGGPAVDDAGMLLGVAVGRLNDIAVLRATGSLPQGVNFAIRAAEVEGFLAEQGVQPARGSGGGGTGARAVSALVAPAVFQIICRG
jgi:S1-C subfamily serine protease